MVFPPSQVERGFSSSLFSSLEPCPSGTDATLLEAPYNCGATATVILSDGSGIDSSSQLRVAQDCDGCAPCLLKAAVQGLCSPGTYSYIYSLDGFAANATRIVTVSSIGSFEAQLSFISLTSISPQFKLSLEVSRS